MKPLELQSYIKRMTGIVIPQSTFKYWEQEGILKVNRKREGTHRDYSQDDATIILIATLMRHLQFKMEEIRRFIETNDSGIKEEIIIRMVNYKVKAYPSLEEAMNSLPNIILKRSKHGVNPVFNK